MLFSATLSLNSINEVAILPPILATSPPTFAPFLATSTVEEATLDAFFMPELAIFLKPEKRPPDFAGATFADRLITFYFANLQDVYSPILGAGFFVLLRAGLRVGWLRGG